MAVILPVPPRPRLARPLFGLGASTTRHSRKTSRPFLHWHFLTPAAVVRKRPLIGYRKWVEKRHYNRNWQFSQGRGVNTLQKKRTGNRQGLIRCYYSGQFVARASTFVHPFTVWPSPGKRKGCVWRNRVIVLLRSLILSSIPRKHTLPNPHRRRPLNFHHPILTTQVYSSHSDFPLPLP